VLLYHRITESPFDPWDMSVTPQHFAQHLEILTNRCQPMGLGEMVRALCAGRKLRRAVAITFDDGYADNLHNARPLLERYGVPATVFVTTGGIDSEHGFWWDELERLVLRTEELPGALALRVHGKSFHRELGKAARPGTRADLRRRWRKGDSAPDARCALYGTLWELLQPLPASEQRKVLRDVANWAGNPTREAPDHRTLSAEGIRSLAKGGLIEIGAHTVTHPVLAVLPAGCQKREMQQSKDRLQAIVNAPVTSFSYPFGSPGLDYTPQTAALVREAGFNRGCSGAVGLLGRHTDRYQLPRLTVPDCDGEAFSRLF
jgi:peptidoglycan/xylan/chitin deacetylase (PgdA/CDA1 family)